MALSSMRDVLLLCEDPPLTHAGRAPVRQEVGTIDRVRSVPPPVQTPSVNLCFPYWEASKFNLEQKDIHRSNGHILTETMIMVLQFN